jgi:hypothetical protein
MLITKIYLAAMSRADESRETLNKLPSFYLMVDEFQSFADKSFADILSEARKYKLCLTMAHQYIEQMEDEVREAVFGNVGTMITFRVGSYDAEVLEKEFAPVFTAEDIVNLGLRQIYLRLMIDNVGSQPFSATTLPPIPEPSIKYVKEIIDHSRKLYARPKVEVEKTIIDWHAEGKRADAPAPMRPRVAKPETQPADLRAILREKMKPATPAPAPRPQSAPKPFLETLKDKNNNQRKPAPQNVSALKDVLSKMTPPQSAPSNPVPAPKPAPNPTIQKKEPTPEELKKIFDAS